MLCIVPANTASALSDYSIVKVQLVSAGSPTSVQFVVKGAYRIEEAPNQPLFPGVTYTMKVSGTGMELNWSDGVQNFTLSLGAAATFKQYANGSATNYLYLKNPGYGWLNYTGDMRFSRPSGTGYIRLVNTLPLDTYLYGVVSQEMSNSWPIEALKAQAIVARTYAMRYIKAADADKEYHIGDTTAAQVYKGYPANNANVIAAVDQTAGQALTYNGALVDGVFSASDGGYIRTATEKWGGASTYHVAKDDPYDIANPSSPSFDYYMPAGGEMANLSSLSATQLAKTKILLSLLKAQVAKDASVGMSKVTIDKVTGITLATLRKGMSAGSHEFTQVKFTTAVHINGTAKTVTAILNYTDVNGNAKELKTSFATYNSLINTSNLWEMYASQDSNFFHIVVRGYGHGVGLSQRGAQQMANTINPKTNAKHTSTDILEFYYNYGGFDKYGTKPTKVTTYTLTKPVLAQLPAPTGANAAPVGVVTGADQVNVRAGGNASATSLATLAKGTQVKVLSQTAGGWYRIFYQPAGLIGYLSGTYLQLPAGAAIPTESAGSTPTPTKTATPTPTKTATPTPAKTPSPQGKTTTNVNLRSKASTSGSILTTVPKGATVTILNLSAAAGWYQVQYSGKTGYMSSQYVTVIKTTTAPAKTATPTPTKATPTPTKTVTPTKTPSPQGKTTTNVNLRSKASTSSSVLLTVPKGKTITILNLKAASGWYQVQYSGKTGYMSSQYVTVVKTTTAPAKTATPTPTKAAATPKPTTSTTTNQGKTTTNVNLRSKASTSGSILLTVPKGKTITILNLKAATGWYQVKYSTKTGYMSSKYVTVTTPTKVSSGSSTSKTATGTVTASSLNLRKSASTSAAILKVLKKNTSVSILGKKSGGGYVWYKVQVGSTTGWSASNYIKATGTIPTVS